MSSILIRITNNLNYMKIVKDVKKALFKIEQYAKDHNYVIDENGTLYHNGNIIKGTLINGYKITHIRINNVLHTLKFHRFQAFCIYGYKIYNSDLVVRHLNNIKTDNSVSNIKLGTYKQNSYDNPKEDRMERALYATSFVKKYDHDYIKELHKTHSYSEIMKITGIKSKGTLSYIINH